MITYQCTHVNTIIKVHTSLYIVTNTANTKNIWGNHLKIIHHVHSLHIIYALGTGRAA